MVYRITVVGNPSYRWLMRIRQTLGEPYDVTVIGPTTWGPPQQYEQQQQAQQEQQHEDEQQNQQQEEEPTVRVEGPTLTVEAYK